MRKLFISLILASVFLPCAAESWQVNSSGSFVSQYIFRGHDANNRDAALQFDFNAEHKGGFTLGIWGSNYANSGDDATDPSDDEKGVEVDLYVSYSHAINQDVSVFVGLTEYTYSGSTDSSTEFNLGASWKNFSLTYYDDSDLDTSYISLDAEFPLSEKNTLVAHFGHVDPDNADSERDYLIGINHAYNDSLSFYVNFTFTSVDDTDNLWGGVTVEF